MTDKTIPKMSMSITTFKMHEFFALIEIQSYTIQSLQPQHETALILYCLIILSLLLSWPDIFITHIYNVIAFTESSVITQFKNQICSFRLYTLRNFYFQNLETLSCISMFFQNMSLFMLMLNVCVYFDSLK